MTRGFKSGTEILGNGSYRILFWNGGADPGEEHAVLVTVLLRQTRCFLKRLVWRGGNHWEKAHAGRLRYVLKEGRRQGKQESTMDLGGFQQSTWVEVKLRHDFVMV